MPRQDCSPPRSAQPATALRLPAPRRRNYDPSWLVGRARKGHRLQLLRSPDDATWLEIAARCDSATFFHTPHWRDLVLRAFPEYRDATVGVTLDGIRSILPMLESGRSTKGFHRHLVSTFAGCYGGLISEAPIPAGQKPQIYERLLGRRVGSLEMTECPLEKEASMPPGFSERPYSTHLLHLERGWEAVQRGFSRGNRASINRGHRQGVTCRIATDRDGYHDYYEVYLTSLCRWGDRATSRYPRRLFETGADLARDRPDNMRLWLAESQGKVLAGAWVFYWNRHAVYWHGATDEAYSSLRPSNVLHARIIQDACERGCLWYDFNPSGGHEGVARFKRSFGATERPVRVWRYRSASAELLTSVKSFLR